MEIKIIKDEPNKKVLQVEMDWHEMQDLKDCIRQVGEVSTIFENKLTEVLKKLT